MKDRGNRILNTGVSLGDVSKIAATLKGTQKLDEMIRLKECLSKVRKPTKEAKKNQELLDEIRHRNI